MLRGPRPPLNVTLAFLCRIQDVRRLLELRPAARGPRRRLRTCRRHNRRVFDAMSLTNRSGHSLDVNPRVLK